MNSMQILDKKEELRYKYIYRQKVNTFSLAFPTISRYLYSIYLPFPLMRSKNYPYLILLIILILFSGGLYVFSEAAIHYFSGSTWVPHVLGTFNSTYGNAGTISFDRDPWSSYSKANLAWTDITGFFWSETTGWAEFTGGTNIILRNVANGGVREVWDASGYAWSDYAGWLTLSWVEYYPDTATLSGWLWSDTLGWTLLNTLAQNVWAGFAGRIAVIGTVAGNNIYSLNIPNYQAGATFNISNIANVINTTKKNIALWMRNVTTSLINLDANTITPNIKVLGQSIYYSYTWTSDYIVPYTLLETRMNSLSSPRSLIVVWGDIYMDTGVTLDSTVPPHAIIALKNDRGNGGNIYIDGNVTKIHSSLIAEWSLFSARRAGNSWLLYNNDHNAATTLPNYQLYVFGSIISHNTIGWAGVPSVPKCPYTEAVCTYDQALRYDLNYFRDFQTWAISPQSDVPYHRGKPDPAYNDKSVVIEYDPRVLNDLPPWL